MSALKKRAGKKENGSSNLLRGLLLCFLVIFFVFQDLFQTTLPPLKYMDELFAAALFPMLILVLFRKNLHYQITKRSLLMIFLIIALWFTGYYGFVRNRYQPLGSTLRDSVACVKYFMSIGTSCLIFIDSDLKKMQKLLWKCLGGVTLCLFVLCIADLGLHIFPGGHRYGLRTVRLFYTSFSQLATMCLFLCVIYLRLFEFYRDRILPWLCMLFFVIAWTMRIKAFMGVICVLFAYIRICRMRRSIGPLAWSLMGVSGIAIGIRQFRYYFETVESARKLLTKESIIIARDYFPFGTGWGTFGSAFSGNPYSPVYRMYNLDDVWGLTRDYYAFVSDTFWPMILAQCGFVGAVLYVLILVLLALEVFSLGRKNAYAMASGLVSLLYLVIASTSESAFVNTYAVPYAFWLGVLFAGNRKSDSK